ncbi:MAG TPA: DNA-deoxyinosine glycosylase [Terracidiphilus sp.]|nr:DNA-deoxyinosine glycosylase [Terracidiphilus sp.]
MRKSGLPAVVDGNTEILILGTLPSDKSLASGQYYANPGNDFWKLVGAALNLTLDGLPYEAKIESLKANRIGLWDAYHSGVRPGSMDGNITGQELNDLTALKNTAPNIRLICFNGEKAASVESRLLRLGYQTLCLPSSSSANRKNQAERLRRWKEAIKCFVIDFNKKYGLTLEPVLDDAELLSPDPLSSMFVRVDTGLMPSLTDVQAALAPILLIPQVPESVERTFRIAKRLYLFGRFEYGFYSASQHYAHLAMEAAILSRWTVSLPNPVLVQAKSFRQQMTAPSHGQLAELYWMKDGRNLLVDGKPFPSSPTKVLKRLRECGIIDCVTAERIAASIGLRNDMSHHESPTVLPPSTDTLTSTAELINTLFDNVALRNTGA